MKGLKIVNKADRGEIYIYGTIVDDLTGSIYKQYDIDGLVFPKDVKEQLDDLKGKPIDVYISSDGGSVASGFAIANMLKRHDAPTVAHIDSWAASIASVIALACDSVEMPKNTYMMIHLPWCACAGNAKDLREIAEFLDRLGQSFLTLYADVKTDAFTEDEIWQKMVDETWLDSKECADMFRTVKVTEFEAKSAACATTYENAPDAVKAMSETDTMQDIADLLASVDNLLGGGVK